MKVCHWMIFLTLLTVAGCGSDTEETTTEDQLRFAEVILNKGGKFTINDIREVTSLSQLPDGSFKITGVDFNNTSIGDIDLEEIAGMRDIKYLGLHSTSVTDNCMSVIKNMTNLRELEISYTQLSNDSVDTLVQLKKLNKIFMSGTNIKEHGLVRLKDELPNCKLINLQTN